MSSQDPYRYNPLAPREIRVVVLYPLTSTNEICLDLQQVTLDDNPSYEALSYTWEIAGGSVQVQAGSRFLEVTKNLAAALRALSPLHSRRTIWIDALCINQKDTTERNHQVQFMKQIYAKASRVIVWLGPTADDSDNVMEYVATLDYDKMFSKYVERSRANNIHQGNANMNVHATETLPVAQQGVNALFSRSWFGHVWVMQEACVNEETFFICGQKQVKRSQLLTLAWKYHAADEHEWASEKLSSCAWKGTTFLIGISRYIRDPPDLFLALKDGSRCEATDPRDRIFAVQHLARNHGGELERLVIEPRYDQDARQAYTNLALRLMESRGLYIISWAGRSTQSRSDLPSWVPDWSVGGMWKLEPYNFSAAGQSEADYRVDGDDCDCKRLLTKGSIVSSLSALEVLPGMDPMYSAHLDDPAFIEPLSNHIDACTIFITQANSPHANQTELWRTLVADKGHSITRLPKDYGDAFVEFPAWLATHREKAPTGIPDAYQQHVNLMNGKDVFMGRTFAIDTEGNMCLVPKAAHTGDSIVIVSGLALPLIVRSCDGGEYEIIGDCYVNGYMDGEAMDENESKGQFEEMVFR